MNDYDVIREVKEGNTEAFAVLVGRYHRHLLNFIFRVVGDEAIVEDLGQEVFLSVYKSLKDFDEKRGTPFSAWLFITARNRSISELRSRRGRRQVRFEDIAELESAENNAEAALICSQERRALRSSLEQLPEPYRGAILRSLDGHSLKEIAEVDGISAGTVKSRLFRARRMLRALMNGYYEGGGYERI